ncbi:hypothetical protein ABZP36_021840 [Zizania latifolia]
MPPPNSARSSSASLPLAAAPTSNPVPSSPPSQPPPNPLAAASSFFHHHLSRFACRLAAPLRPALAAVHPPPGRQGASLSLAIAPDEVARALTGTPSSQSMRMRQPMLGKGSKVVPITLDQVYMLKAEGIAFRFLPDPLQIKNALELKCGLTAFDGVPVFQSDLLVVKKQKKRYCPIYFQKEDIERELTRAPKTSRGSALSKQIMVGSLEDVLKKMETNDRNSGWHDLIFIPPGKSLNQHINESPPMAAVDS